MTAPQGFVASAVAAGLKPGGALDVALVARRAGAVPAAAVFTTNKVAAAPVVVSRRHIAGGVARAVVINAGNANACTGAQGIVDAETTAATLAELLGGAAERDRRLVDGRHRRAAAGRQAARGAARRRSRAVRRTAGRTLRTAIMTTDTVAKEAAVDGRCRTVARTRSAAWPRAAA